MSLMLKSLIKNRITIALLSVVFFSLTFLLTNANASEIDSPKINVVSQKYLQQNKRTISSAKKIKSENLAKFEINNDELLELKGFKVMKKISYKKLNVSLAKMN